MLLRDSERFFPNLCCILKALKVMEIIARLFNFRRSWHISTRRSWSKSENFDMKILTLSSILAGNLPRSLLHLKFACLKNFGRLLEQNKDLKGALQVFKDAIEIDGEDVMLWWKLGNVAFQLRNLGLARFAAETGTGIHLDSCSCMYRLGQPNAEPDSHSAHHLLLPGLRLDAKSALCMDLLINTLFVIGDLPACLRVVRSALEVLTCSKLLQWIGIGSCKEKNFQSELHLSTLGSTSDAESQLDSGRAIRFSGPFETPRRSSRMPSSGKCEEQNRN